MKSKKIKLILLIAVFLLCMFFFNRDLFHYQYSYPYDRIFMPDEDPKGDYLITDPIPLKKGIYQLSFAGSSDGLGNGCFIADAQDNVFFRADIPSGTINEPYPVEIQKNTSVRIGFSYDPAGGILNAGHIVLVGEHILFRESVLRHAVISLILVLIFVYAVLRLLKPPDLPKLFRKKTGRDLLHCEKMFLILILLTVLSSWPLFKFNCFTEGDDFYFHASRIEGMVQTLKAGYFPPRILLGWMSNYGVGSGFYYPDLFFYFPAALCSLGFTTVTAIKVFFFICTFFSLLTMYLTGKSLCNNNFYAGIISAVLYAFASYRLICLFYRNAVGELQAFIFYPLVVWGLFEILRGNYSRWTIFALGFWGLLMSHMISLAISGLLCAVCLLVFIRKLLSDRKIILSLIKASVVTVLSGAFFLFPMMEQVMNNDLQINTYLNSPFSINYFNWTKFSNLFIPFDQWSAVNGNWIRPHPGWIILLIPLCRLFLLICRRNDPGLKTADGMMVAGIMLLIISTDLFPWELFKWFLMRIQFSWRFLGAATVLLCISGGIYSVYLISLFTDKEKKRFCVVVCFAAVLSGLPVLIYTWNSKMIPSEVLKLSDKIVSGAEYIPAGFDIEFIDRNKDQILYDEKITNVSNPRRKKLGFLFDFEKIAEDQTGNYSVPLFYFYGYTADLSDENGQTVKIPVTKDEIGLVQVSDNGISKGSIRIAYEKTTIQKISECVSILTLMALLLYIVKKRCKSRGQIP